MPTTELCVQDDAGALFDHGIDNRLRGMENAAKIDIDDIVELLQRHFLQTGVAGDTGVVHNDIDASICVAYFGDHFIDLRTLRDVDGERFRFGARFRAHVRDRRHGIKIHVAGNHDRFFARKLQRRCCTDPLPRACDDGDFSTQSHCWTIPF